MRYRLPIDKLTNRLVPHYLSGRRYILFLQSIVHPLQSLNDWFVGFARQKQIEARMTSQVLYFEWYLNHKFGKYLADDKDRIYLSESKPLGVDLYHEGADPSKPFTVWYESEKVMTAAPTEEPRQMSHTAEEKAIGKVSFMVCVPEIAISEHEFVYMLSHTVNTYKLAGKTYLIKINSHEHTPNRQVR